MLAAFFVPKRSKFLMLEITKMNFKQFAK